MTSWFIVWFYSLCPWWIGYLYLITTKNSCLKIKIYESNFSAYSILWLVWTLYLNITCRTPFSCYIHCIKTLTAVAILQILSFHFNRTLSLLPNILPCLTTNSQPHFNIHVRDFQFHISHSKITCREDCLERRGAARIVYGDGGQEWRRTVNKNYIWKCQNEIHYQAGSLKMLIKMGSLGKAPLRRDSDKGMRRWESENTENENLSHSTSAIYMYISFFFNFLHASPQ